jgi:hypothetical protein
MAFALRTPVKDCVAKPFPHSDDDGQSNDGEDVEVELVRSGGRGHPAGGNVRAHEEPEQEIAHNRQDNPDVDNPSKVIWLVV